MSFIAALLATFAIAPSAAPPPPAEIAPPEVLACGMADSASVEAVLGEGATDLSDSSMPDMCMFQGPDGWALLTIQKSSADLYDQITILEPHTAVDIGDQGRYNIEEGGSAAVQFVKGEASVTLSLKVFRPGEREYVPALLDLARAVAAQTS